MSQNSVQQLNQSLAECLLADQFGIRQLLRRINERRKRQQPVDQMIEKAQALIAASQLQVKRRTALLPSLQYPAELPVVAEKATLLDAISKNQIVVIAGETGSGKTTQIPKICLEAGLGRKGLIGHTQPRRIAATSVASRIAEELEVELGKQVGFSVRFHDRTSDDTLIELMTDGILLNEIQKDPWLNRYEVIIIDEAHERSLNIDFLLGYLKYLTQKRRDLKVIVTSATIDPEKFSRHFNDCPVLTVEGRTYPVEVRYRNEEVELAGVDPMLLGIEQALVELYREGPGDVLVFLSGEGEIRQVANHLRKLKLNHTEVLPLYARLSIKEQERVFHPSGKQRRVVLATNVAETSLTVPGIRYVIDTGFARISRFSSRSKVQRLPIEPISQASAEQRKGRCGRVANGICIRLYSEEDFLARPEFTDPEILRTNLAHVILQLKLLRLGDIGSFPFIDPPKERQVKDGMQLLEELHALDHQQSLTTIGRRLAQLPIDPRLGRMLLAAEQEKALREVLVIATFLAVRDPRERPFDKQQKADEQHTQYADIQSDFVSVLNLWRDLQQKREELSNSQFRRYCQKSFINFNAFLEWRNTYRQLKQHFPAKVLQHKEPATYEQLHKALLPGLLSHIGNITSEGNYQGARNSRFFLHPSSVIFKSRPKWVMAAELVETGKLYARVVAKIEPEWVEAFCGHLEKITYLAPHWSKRRGTVIANMQKSLYGLVFVSNRKVDYSSVDAALARSELIEKGLLDQEIQLNAGFLSANAKLRKEVEQEQAKLRRTDILKEDYQLIEWFEERLPSHIVNAKTLLKWLNKKPENAKRLRFSKDDLIEKEELLAEQGFPKHLQLGDARLKLSYHFEPGAEDDGVTVWLPLVMLDQFDAKPFEWLVPGMLEEKVQAFIKGLPKQTRKNFIPAPDFANAAYLRITDPQNAQPIEELMQHDFTETLRRVLQDIAGVAISNEALDQLQYPAHLLMNFKVVDVKGKHLSSGRDLKLLQQQLAGKLKQSLKDVHQTITDSDADITRWQFGELPLEKVLNSRAGQQRTFQALSDQGNAVRLKPMRSREEAEKEHLRGVCRLLCLHFDKELKYLRRSWQHRREMAKLSLGLGGFDSLVDQTAMAVCKDELLSYSEPLTSETQYSALCRTLSGRLIPLINEVLLTLKSLLNHLADIRADKLRAIESTFPESFDDIHHQLDRLFSPDFLYRYGVSCLADHQRYLNALNKRFERMNINYPKEAEGLRIVAHWQRQLDKIIAKVDCWWLRDDLVKIWCMLEEFRISLFAPTMKTKFPISDKRLEKQFSRIKS